MREFGTVITCMDGRIQRKVSDYLLASFGVPNLDTITAAGVVRHLADNTDRTETILSDVDVSITKHGSEDIAVVAHHDCAGNPAPDGAQKDQIAQAVSRLMRRHPTAEVIGLWLGRDWAVERIRAVP